MSNYRRVKLGNVATYVNGYPFKPSEWSEEGLPIIRIQNLTDPINSAYNNFDGSISDKYTVKPGDVLISWSATLGVYEWMLDDALLNQHIFKVVFNKENVDKRYFIYAVSNVLQEMQRHIHGSTMKHIVKGAFDNIEIPLPPLPEQRRIAETLDRAQRLIDLRKKQIEEMDRLAQAVFIDMFGDPVRNEKGWDYKQLQHLTVVSSSKRIFQNEYVSEGVPFYRTKEVSELSEGQEISIELFISYTRYCEIKEKYGVPDVGDMLVSAVGTIGVCWVVSDNRPFYYKDGNLLIVKKSKLLNSIFLRYYLEMIFAKKASEMVGSAYNALTIEKFKFFDVFLPPKDMQDEFGKIITDIESKMKLQKSALAQQNRFFNQLSSLSFNQG